MISPTDPVERVIADALTERGIAFIRSDANRALDFHLPDYDLHIECKQFHSPRIAEQMSRHQNVIAIQGLDAAKAFASMIRPPAP